MHARVPMHERDVVRELARRVAELAAGRANSLAAQRWRDVNALRRPDRAPVWCRPVGCWEELLPEDSLLCGDPYLRGIEREFRRHLIKASIGDDSIIPDAFEVHAAFRIDPPNRWGVDVIHDAPPCAGGSWAYRPPLRTEDDLGRLRAATFTFDRARTQELIDRAHDLLGDIMPVRLVCWPPGPATLGTPAADLRGLEQLMLDTIDNPRLLHRLMAFLRDAVLSADAQVESTGLLTPNNTGPMLCSEPVGPPVGDGPLKRANLWCHANSQEFDQVSPAAWEEFCLNYQKPILATYGLVHYGCCENLTHKLDGVLAIPNLRIVTCSAWTDLDTVIDRCGRRYVIQWRQKAADVVFADDVGAIHRHLEDGAKRLRGCFYQIVLRELQTLGGSLDRLHVWARIASDVAAAYA